MKTLFKLTPLVALLFALSTHARMGELSTLEKVSQTATISLGHRESSVPFSYYDNHRNVVGYSHELMLAVVARIQKALALPALTIRLVPVTSQNRISMVLNGSVDLECGSTTHNRDRARQVGFSISIFRTSSRLLTRHDSGIEKHAELAGRRLVVTAGTTSERASLLLRESTGVKYKVISAKDHGEAFAWLQAGRADAFMMDEAVLFGLRAKAERPEDWTIVGNSMAAEVYACMLRKDDPGFKNLVDQSLAELMQSGEARRVYERWFESPIPPNKINLRWPLPAAMRDLYQTPNDKPLN